MRDVKWKKLNKAAKIPTFAHHGDSGCDVCCIEDFTLESGGMQLVNTGLCVEIPQGFEMQIRPKSGLAVNQGIIIINTPGTVDSGYRGEIKVILHKLRIPDLPQSKTFKAGDKVAQLVFVQVAHPDFVIVDELNKTNRGKNGFGSSGK